MWSIVSSAARDAWFAANSQQGQLEALQTAIGTSPRLAVLNASLSELSRVTLGAPTINTGTTPRRLELGDLVAGSLVHTATGAPAFVEIRNGSTVILRAPAGTAGAFVAFAGPIRQRCAPSIGAGEITVQATAGLPAVDVVAWAAGAETGSVTSGVWTPGRNASGVITQASVDALPADTWVAVAGTELNQLTAAISAISGFPFSRYDVSGDGIRGTFDAWVGCCDDGLSRIFYPRGGGHADNSANGIWRFDCLRMQWQIERMPSDPQAPGAVWSSRYAKGPAPDGGTYTRYIDEAGITVDADGIYWDRLPDGTPTSAHTYNGVWYDSTRNQIGTSRISKWVYDRATQQWARTRWTVGGTVREATIYHDLHYHAATDYVYGPLGVTDFEYFQFRRFPASSGIVENLTLPAGWQVRGSNGVRLDADRVWWSWQNSGERAAIHNMATNTWEVLGPVTNGRTMNGFATMQAGVYVPTWGAQGKIIRRGAADSGQSNQWWLYDLATNTNEAYTPAGNPPPSGTAYPGNKYLRIGNLGIVVAMHEPRSWPTSSPCMYVLRYA
jgi:hypothetical protein